MKPNRTGIDHSLQARWMARLAGSVPAAGDDGGMPGSGDFPGAGMKAWAVNVNADMAAFIQPAEALCVSASGPSAPIPDADRLLLEMRGPLYRFTHAMRRPLVMNDGDDSRRSHLFTGMPVKVLCCPAFHDEAVVAILVLLNRADRADFSSRDRKLAEVLANHLASLPGLPPPPQP
jgi:hypothetical protein